MKRQALGCTYVYEWLQTINISGGNLILVRRYVRAGAQAAKGTLHYAGM